MAVKEIPFRCELGGKKDLGDINRFLTLTFQRGINNKIMMLVLMDKRTIATKHKFLLLAIHISLLSKVII